MWPLFVSTTCAEARPRSRVSSALDVCQAAKNYGGRSERWLTLDVTRTRQIVIKTARAAFCRQSRHSVSAAVAPPDGAPATRSSHVWSRWLRRLMVLIFTFSQTHRRSGIGGCRPRSSLRLDSVRRSTTSRDRREGLGGAHSSGVGDPFETALPRPECSGRRYAQFLLASCQF